jgi:DNA-binding NarL/FixJ family response regulator
MANPNPAAAKRRVLIVDDHPLFRDGLRRFLDLQPDLACCGEADSCRTGFDAAARLKPDLVILDLRLHREDGTELLRNLQALQPRFPVLVLSQREDTIHALPALRAGARGYVMKEEATDELLKAIRSVLGGKVYLSQRLSGLVMNKFCGRAVAGNGPGDRLSDRERQVFQLLGSGLSTQQIADQLHLSPKTVETHRENIKHKLGLLNAAGVVHAAQDWLRASGE